MITANELRLLEALAAGPTGRLEPSEEVGVNGVGYPDAEEYLPDAESVADTLRALAERGLLVVTDERTVRVCPDCRFDSLAPQPSCGACGSAETVECDVIEHLSCGCTVPRAEFETEGDDYVCPECGGTLRALGVDYAKIGTQYRCRACGERSDAPEDRFVCGGCREDVAPEAVHELDAHTYRFDEERRDWLDGQLFVKRDLENRLRERGFSVTANATVHGASGRSYPVHLRATDELLGIDLGVSVTGRLTDHDIGHLTLLAEDARVHPVLVTLEEAVADETLEPLAEQFGIAILRASEYVARTEEQLDAVVGTNEPTSAD